MPVSAALIVLALLTGNVEGVLQLTRGVLLRNEHGVEVPERRLDEVVRRHLGETVVSSGKQL